jgi:LysR family transcriptional regulator, transcriptional activator for aaeXAB operon
MLVAVVQSGSMRAAARDLRVTPAAVSQQIRQLEEETGVTLLRRSTRQLALTDAGEAFYQGCLAMLDAARAAHERLAELHDAVSGELSISAPAGFAAAHLTRALAPLLAAHAALTLRVLVTDDLPDVQKERIDFAITIGTTPPASTLVRRHLADWDNVLVASPAYLKARGTPRTPAELEDHAFVALPRWHHPADVLIGPGGQRYRLAVKPRITSNNQAAIKEFTLAGCGMSFGVIQEMSAEFAARRLVRVLPEWPAPRLNVDALLLPRKTQPAKVRAALDALKKYLATLVRSESPASPA